MSLSLPKFKLTPAEKTLTRKALVFLVSFTLVTVLTALASMFYTRLHQPMIVPKILGMDEQQAGRALESKGLHLKIIRSVYDEHMPVGLLDSQNPRANSYLRRGQTVTAVLSKGNPRVSVPAVVGQAFTEAQIALAGAHLRVGRESLIDSPETRDVVLAQVPEAGTTVDSFTEVSLLVSAGPKEPAFVMPNLKNQPLDSAFKILRPAGITIQKITSEVRDDLDTETILAQSPPPGARIQRKDSVSFTVSTKSSSTWGKGARYAKVDYDMPPGNPRRLQIDVLDSSGTRTIYNRMESPGDHVEVGVSVTGKASAQVYLNQEFVREIPIN